MNWYSAQFLFFFFARSLTKKEKRFLKKEWMAFANGHWEPLSSCCQVRINMVFMAHNEIKFKSVIACTRSQMWLSSHRVYAYLPTLPESSRKEWKKKTNIIDDWTNHGKNTNVECSHNVKLLDRFLLLCVFCFFFFLSSWFGSTRQSDDYFTNREAIITCDLVKCCIHCSSL